MVTRQYNVEDNSAISLYPIQGGRGIEIVLVTSCYCNPDKRQAARPAGRLLTLPPPPPPPHSYKTSYTCVTGSIF